MFGKRSKQPTPQSPQGPGPEGDPFTAPPNPEDRVDTVEVVEERSFAEEARERIIALQTAQSEFVVRAIEAGVPEDEIAGFYEDAINSGAVPPLVQGLTGRGSGGSVVFLTVPIPRRTLSVRVLEQQGSKQGIVDIGDFRALSEAGSLDEASYYKYPQTDGGEQVDHEMLDRIDGALAGFEAQPE